jgi:uncharacterized protein (TIGR00255 family)
MIGMTGYSFKEIATDDASISTEIKSVNSRFLDINVNVPYYLNFMDIKIRELLKNKLIRGKVDITVNIKLNEKQSNISANLDVAKQYIENLNKIIKHFNLKDEIRLFHLTKYDDIISSDRKKDYSKYWGHVSKNISENLIELIKMKEKEGSAIKKDLNFIIKRIDTNLKTIIKKVPKMEKELYTGTKNKIFELLKSKIDESRLLTETAILVNKSCINEEIKRLETYIIQFNDIIEEKSDIGKRVDFLCKEMHREINTIGSKVTLAELTTNVIIIKNDIEKIREHIRNIE